MRIKYNYYLVATLLFFLAFSSNAQYNQPLEDFVIEVWSAEEGLPSNNLRHVTKDQNGFLWICTFNGLVRFDGNEFKNFTTENVPALSTSVFYSVLPYDKGKMFISTQSSGLIQFDNGVFSRLKGDVNLPTSVQTTFLDSKNRLWIGTRNNGVYYIENNKSYRVSIPSFDDQSIMSFVQDSGGAIWIASEGAGIAKFNAGDITIYTEENGLNSNIVNSILLHNGKLYAGTEKGLSVYEKGIWSEDNRFGKPIINQITVDEKNNLWLASDIGLARMTASNDIEFINEKDGLPSRQVSSIAFDDENNIWLSTKRGGLAQLKLSNFKNLSPLDGLSYQGINVIEEGPDGTIYFGSDNGDLDVLKDGKISKLAIKKNLVDVSIKDILAEEDGTLWIATYDGVIKKKKDSEQYYDTSNGLLSLKTRRILRGSDGVLWVGSRNGGLNKILPNGKVESIDASNGLGSDFVFSVDEAPDGRIVIGTANGGLDIIHKNGNIEILKPDSTLTGLSIFNVYIENDNRFWLATNVGLYCYQNNKFHLIRLQNGLPVETLFDIQEDEKGNLWSSSIIGMVRINKQEALDFIDGLIDEINSTVLDDSDGMISRECTGATTTFQSLDGRLWVPTIKGVAILDPQHLVENTKVPSVFIEGVMVDDEQLDASFCCGEEEDNAIIIAPGHRNYIISYTSLSMYSPKKVFFKYKLEGFDRDWVEIGPVRQAKYTNLPYGTYTFKVLAANNNGVWSSEYASTKIIIEPYFYETKWFVILLIMIFIIFTFLIYTYQTKEVNRRNIQLEKLNKELDSFAYSVSHDIKAPLTSIQGLLNVARLEKGKDALSYYDRIETSVDKLDSFIKDIIDYSKNSRMGISKESINVRKMISNMVEGLAYLSNGQKVKATIKIDENLEIITDKTRFSFIANNIITNAFRYADFEKEFSTVDITARKKGSRFYLVVEDNGQGIKKEYQDKVFEMFYRANEFKSGSGLGLYIVKESLDKIGGTVKLKSELGVGTKITIEFPV